jgi:Putative transposase
MGALFRDKMSAALRHAHERGTIDLSSVDVPALFKTRWVVYAKRPFGGPQQVVRYLGRYIHRVGISNSQRSNSWLPCRPAPPRRRPMTRVL